MATFTAGQISFIFLVFVLLVLAIALVICTKHGNKQKMHNHHNNNDIYGFYQKKVSFQLDDNLDDSNHLVLPPPMNEIPPSLEEQKILEDQKKIESQRPNEIIDTDITTAFVSI